MRIATIRNTIQGQSDPVFHLLQQQNEGTMGINTTLYNGLSGLNIFSDNMNVLADNVANVNTTGFKSSSSSFAEVIADASGQFNKGAGAQLESVASNFAVGSLDTTNVSSDMAIDGRGFFVVKQDAASPDLYTRDGQFSLQPSNDSQDVLNLENALGYYVQGYAIDPATGTTAAAPGNITINRISDPQATENIQASFNLEASAPAPIGTPALYQSWDGRQVDPNGQPDPISSDAYNFSSDLKIIDDQGDSHDLTIYFANTPNANQKAFLLTCDPIQDKRLIGTGPARYNDSGAVVNKGAGALLYGLLQFNSQGDLQDISCYKVPADGNVDPDRATNLLQLGRGEPDYSFTFNFTGQGNDLSSTINFGTTAVAQSITSPDALLASGPGEPAQPASSTSTWNEVFDANGNKPTAGEVIHFAGTDGAGNAVNYSYTINPSSQIADLLANLQDQFNCTAILKDGKLQLTDNEVGASQLAINSITYQDASGATPATSASLAQVFGTEGDAFSGQRPLQTATGTEALLLTQPGEPGQFATSTSTWSEVYDANGNQPAAGEVITFNGTDGAGTPVTYSYTIDPSKQIADLLTNLQAQFNCGVALVDGKLQLSGASSNGTSQLGINSITFQDASGATPATDPSLAQVFGDEGDSFLNRQQPIFQLSSNTLATTDYANPSSVLNTNQDGYGKGYLESISVDKNGIISGNYSNGHQVAEAQLVLSDFTDYTGLKKTGANIYTATSAVGTISTGTAGSNGLGPITGGALESSNVDLGDQFAQLITTQRYYQANSKSISVAEAVYDTLVNMIT